MANKNFIYGIARVLFNKQEVGWIEKGSWDWGGSKGEITEVFAEQVPATAVLVLSISNGTIKPTFNLIQLSYAMLKMALGGELIGDAQNPTGWSAPTSIIQLTGEISIEFVSGQTCTIPNGLLSANLGGKLALTEVSKLEVQLGVMLPEDGTAPYKIEDSKAQAGGGGQTGG